MSVPGQSRDHFLIERSAAGWARKRGVIHVVRFTASVLRPSCRGDSLGHGERYDQGGLPPPGSLSTAHPPGTHAASAGNPLQQPACSVQLSDDSLLIGILMSTIRIAATGSFS